MLTRSRARLTGCAVGAVLAAVVVGAAPAGAAYPCPGRPSPVWGCPEYQASAFDGRFSARPSVTVVGDSLIQLLGPRLADELTATGLFWGHTVGVGGSTFFHWNNGLDGRTLGGWIRRYRPEHAVVALGTNDAGKLGVDRRVTRRAVARQIALGLAGALRATERCVVVVGPSRHNRSPTEAAWVRAELARQVRAAAAEPAGHRFAWVDWEARSAAHPDWFLGPATNPHLTEAGKIAYRDLIVGALVRVQLNGC